MYKEIERKFLVKSDAYKAESFEQQEITQAYLSLEKQAVVRVRITDDASFITIKGESTDGGLSRVEWEKEITKDEAEVLLQLCGNRIIRKQRFKVQVGEHVFEVDEFHGKHQGLVIAEIELKTVDENFEKPIWLGEEVTGDERYYNAVLVAGC